MQLLPELPLRIFVADGNDFLGTAEFQETDVPKRRLDDHVRPVQ